MRHFFSASVAVDCDRFGRFRSHDPHRPLQAGAPVLFGSNFEHGARALAEITPEAKVSNSEQIAQRLDKWLTDEHLRQHIVSLQRPTLPDATAVTRRYFNELSPYLVTACA